jgi:hypothetical protein
VAKPTTESEADAVFLLTKGNEGIKVNEVNFFLNFIPSLTSVERDVSFRPARAFSGV